ncbi:MAG: S41 family peptidase [Bdellovibrio sp.]
MKRFLAILLACCSFFVSYHFFIQESFINPYSVVCNLVPQKIFLEDDELKEWITKCNSRTRLVTPYSAKSLVLQDISHVLELLPVSHLQIYDALEVKNIWQGESLETGIESEFVDSELVIFKVHPHSPAQLLGLKKGDVIKSINQEQPNPWDAQTLSGLYLIERNREVKSYTIKADTFTRSENIEFEKIQEHSAVIHIPSFRAAFFDSDTLQEIGLKLKGTNKLVVDLRGNIGGNFVSGLRFLSLMMCSPQEIGRLIRPRAENKLSTVLPDDLTDDTQLKLFENNSEVILQTFQSKTCYSGSIDVLVDGKTASVAEMVAQALKEFRKASLLGSPSRGELLVGVWYPLYEVGPGVEISIPEAFYLSHKKRRIENQGVELDKVFHYNLSELQNGIDSWVKKALTSP